MSPTMTGEHGLSQVGALGYWPERPTCPRERERFWPAPGTSGPSSKVDRRCARMGGSLRVVPSAPRRIRALEGRAYLAGKDNCIVFEK